MEASEHQALMSRVEQGDLLLGVDRQFARMVFTDLSVADLRERTGEDLQLTKVIAMIAFGAPPLLAAAGGILSMFAFGWWGLLTAPACVFIWLFYKSLSVRGGAGLFLITLAILGVGGLLIREPFQIRSPVTVAALFALALWLERFLYVFTTNRLRALVHRNPRAFAEFQAGISFKGG